MLNGLLGGGSNWDCLIQDLQRALPIYRFIAPDLLGFGKSPWPQGAHNYTQAESSDI